MTILRRLEAWRDSGIISADQYQVLSALASGERFSVFLELNALLYLGVLSLAGGIGWTVQTYFTNLGDAAIILSLTAVLGASLYYCFSRAQPYSPAEVESPTMALDYVLYLGCVVLGIEFGYLEARFEILRAAWSYYLLLSAVVYLGLAYRFDNRLVLSLALSTLAGWFGVSLTRWGVASVDSLRMSAMAYGVVVAGIGAALHYAGLKKHFFETYLHLAATVLLASLLSGVFEARGWMLYLLALVALGGGVIAGGIRYRRFAFVAYGIVAIYVGISAKVLEALDDAFVGMLYGIVSGTMVLVLIVYTARRFGREE